MFDTVAYQSTLLYRDFSAFTSQRLAQLGLHYGVLFLVIYVGKHPGCTQAQLTKALGLDWGYSQRSILKLVEDGFLLRSKQGRAYRLDLSEKGLCAFAVSHQVFGDWDRQALEILDSEEQRQLCRLLRKITEASRGKESE